MCRRQGGKPASNRGERAMKLLTAGADCEALM